MTNPVSHKKFHQNKPKLLIIEEACRKVDADLRRMYPFILRMAAERKRIAEMIKPIEIQHMVVPHQSRYAEIHPNDRKIILGQLTKKQTNTPKAGVEIRYDLTDKKLIRNLAGKELVSQFSGNTTKRLKLFEFLLRQGKYVSMPKLLEITNCPSGEAVRKLVQGINNKVKKDLNISVRIIKGRKGFGYKISSDTKIYMDESDDG